MVVAGFCGVAMLMQLGRSTGWRWLCGARVAGAGLRPAPAGMSRACAATPGPDRQPDTPRFDVFDRYKAATGAESPQAAAEALQRQMASTKIQRLVDEIMCLNLLEAVQLGELIQDKFATGDDSPIVGRMPFPHPMIMFPGVAPPSAPPGMMPFEMPQQLPPQAATAPASAAAAVAAPADAAAAPVAVEKQKEQKKETYSVKLVSFDAAKKINVVKEVRAMTELGLKEAKEFVESVPKVIKKGVPAAVAEAMRDKLAAVGAEVVLE